MLESIFSDIKKEILVISIEMFDIFNKALDVLEEILLLDIDESFDISDLIQQLTNIKDNDIMKNIESNQREDSSVYEEVLITAVETEKSKKLK